MTNLFNERRIEDYFTQIEKEIYEEIGYIEESKALFLDIEDTTNNLIKRNKIEKLKLDKGKISTDIVTQKVDASQLPAGTPIQLGRIYEIEVVKYKIPFIGDIELLRCIPSNFSYNNFVVKIIGNSIEITITKFGKINGNEIVIEELKKEFLRRLDVIENNINSINNDIDKFLPILKDRIIKHLEKRIKQIREKEQSKDKLNPFK